MYLRQFFVKFYQEFSVPGNERWFKSSYSPLYVNLIPFHPLLKNTLAYADIHSGQPNSY